MNPRRTRIHGGASGNVGFAPNPIKQADDIMAEGSRFQRANERARNDAIAGAAGGRPGMSALDRTKIAGEELRRRGLVDPIAGLNRNPAAETQANAAVAKSPVPANINTPNAQAAGATAASPAPRTPAATRFVAPVPLSGPAGNRTTDAAALAANLKNAQDPTAMLALKPAAAQVQAPQVAAVSPGLGKTLSTGRGVAQGLLPMEGPNGYGTGSVSYAKPGDQLAGPSQVTDTGVIGQPPVKPFDQRAAHNALFKTHPEIWIGPTAEHPEIKPSPENIAFNAHIAEQQQNGMPLAQAQQSAYENAHQIVTASDKAEMDALTDKPGLKALNPVIGPDGKIANVATAVPTGAATGALSDKPIAEQAGIRARQAGGVIADVGNAVANAPRNTANAVDRIVSQAATGITGQPQDLHPIASAGRAVKSFAVNALTPQDPTAQVAEGSPPTFQPGDAKWSGNSPMEGPTAPITEAARSQVATPITSPQGNAANTGDSGVDANGNFIRRPLMDSALADTPPIKPGGGVYPNANDAPMETDEERKKRLSAGGSMPPFAME